MRSPILSLILAGLSVATPATAQSMAELVGPVAGSRAEQTIQAMVVAHRLERQQRGGCIAVGCLFIVNRSVAYDLIGVYFFAQPADEKKPPAWSGNVLGRRVEPNATYALMKAGDATLCDVPIRVMMRNRQTRELVPTEGKASLCRGSGVDVFNVRVVRPEVTVEETETTDGTKP